jgi:hypothetical protein
MSGIQRIYRHESTEFTSVPNWVVRDPSYSPNAFRLLAYLLSHSSGYELTYGQIERQTTLGRYAINEAAKFLIAQGWLEWEQEKGPDGKWLAKTWIIKNPQLTNPLPNDSTTEPFRNGTINGHKEEQLLEKNTKERKTNKEKDLFDSFYSEYPRKSAPGDAFKAFKSALRRASYEDIIAGLLRYKAGDLPEKRFIPYPATWLRGDSWENEIAPSPDSEAARRTEERKQRDRESSKAYLAEIKEQEAKAATAPVLCRHNLTIARCVPCAKELS